MTEELKKKLIDYAVKAEPYCVLNHIEVIDVDEGTSRLQVKLHRDLLNRWNTPHGGLLFAMCDVAQGTAILGARQEMVMTVNSTIDYISAAGAEGTLTAIGRVDKMGKTMCFASAEIYDENKKLIVSSHCVMCFTGRELKL